MTLATIGSILILAGILVLAAALLLPFVYTRRLETEETR
jgi:hypothetical protein